MRLRPIAIYLPQFHPIPENDQWWGKGFTEWTNVTKAKPLFKGHDQPHLPADLGFYDLRLPEVMEAQAAMARQHGLEGFMFYHYWFNGKRVLHTPLDNYREKVRSDFPYFLCWANENWSRRWDGSENEILLKQDYCLEDDKAHIEFLCSFFEDERYIKVDGKPVLAVYKTELMPDPLKTAELWRKIALERGLPGLYLIRIEATDWTTVPTQIGFDAAMQFQPDWRNLYKHLVPQGLRDRFLSRLYEHRYLGKIYRKVIRKRPYNYPHLVIDYEKFSKDFYKSRKEEFKRFPCVMPSWDNFARRQQGGAMIFHNSTPELYGRWLREVIKDFTPYSEQENFVFINAWNEWAEGNHLEPSLKWGGKYLEMTRKILDEAISPANI